MRIVMKNVIYILILSTVFSCKNNAQITNIYDKMPLDTIKWSITETLEVDFNQDGIKDVVLVFDKYKALTRPDNIQTPILFYLGTKTKTYSFLKKAEKIIYSPYYEVTISNNTMIINQKGLGEDENNYTNFYKFQNGEIIMFKEIVAQIIEKLKVDDETGDVTTVPIRVDTIHNQIKNIPVDQYDFIKFIQSFK